jgi:uncharacterized protein
MSDPASALPAPPPVVNPETQLFWDGTTQNELRLQRCLQCATFIWYPRAMCPHCHATQLEWLATPGEGIVYSYTIVRKTGGVYADSVPFVVAYVELDEGPRLLTNIVGCDPESVSIGQRVEAVFEDTGEGASLVRFRPMEAP